MLYRRLGRSGLQVSRLGLGTMNFGPVVTEEESHRILDAALDLGLNLVDTADVYGWREGEGWTERIVSRWLARGGNRERIVLATKAYGRMGPGPNDAGLSAYHLVRACDESLRRLGTDRIDIFQMHHVDRHTPWEEIWQAMDHLLAQGKILYVGSSNFAGWHVAAAHQAGAGRGLFGLVSEQSRYNLLERTVELEVIPACRAYGVGVLVWGPLAGGVLAGDGGSGDGRRGGERARKLARTHRRRLERYRGLCQELGEEPAVVALAWLLANPDICAPLIGPRSEEQLRSSLRAIEVDLSSEVLERLDEIFPGPGGEAPEAYAW